MSSEVMIPKAPSSTMIWLQNMRAQTKGIIEQRNLERQHPLTIKNAFLDGIRFFNKLPPAYQPVTAALITGIAGAITAVESMPFVETINNTIKEVGMVSQVLFPILQSTVEKLTADPERIGAMSFVIGLAAGGLVVAEVGTSLGIAVARVGLDRATATLKAFNNLRLGNERGRRV